MSKKSSTFAADFVNRSRFGGIGKMAEWSNAAVLKTVELRGSGGSNPSLSANRELLKEQKRRNENGSLIGLPFFVQLVSQ